MARFGKVLCTVGMLALASTACGRSKRHTVPLGSGGSGGAGGKAHASGGSSGHASGGTGGAAHSGGSGGVEVQAGAAGEAGVSGASEAGGSGAPAVAGNAGAPEAGGAGEAGAGGAGDLGATKVTDVDSFRRAQYDALCSYIFNCDESSSDTMVLRFVLRTEQRCRQVFEQAALREPAFADLDAKVRAGTIELDLTQVSACLDSTARCEPERVKSSFGEGVACRAVFHGSSPLGGPCSRAEDCADDARCVVAAACPGICTARVPLGHTCESDSDCDDHDGAVTCVADNTSSVPTQTCEPRTLHRSALNEACSGSVPNTLTVCDDGLFCDYTTGTCRPPLPADSECDSDDDICAAGQFCRNGRCQVVTIQEHAGDDCDADYVKFCDLFARLYCVNQKCELAGDGTEGALCHPIDYSAWADCNPALVCLDPPAGSVDESPDGLPRSVCGKPRSATQPCVGNDDCASEYCQADGTCGAAYCCGEASCQSN